MPRVKRNATNEVINVEKLETYAERYDRLDVELKAAQDAVKDLMDEMKSKGYNTKQFKRAMKVKEIGYEEYRIEDEEFQMYLQGVGAMPKHEREPVY
jgi:uncharacterized protein (UPF0335 family)